MAVVVNEWLPNPVGPDAEGEWLELFNDSDHSVSLSGWSVENGSGKRIKLGNLQIGPGEYLVLYRKDTKLVLRNRDEALLLYNTQGEVVGRAEFLGSVPEGKSVSRVGGDFLVTEPTPGAANILVGAEIAADPNPIGIPLNRQLASADVIGISLSLGVLISAAVFFAVKQHGRLSQLFFGGNETIGEMSRQEDENKIPF